MSSESDDVLIAQIRKNEGDAAADAAKELYRHIKSDDMSARPDVSWIEFDPKCRHQDPDVLKNAVFGIAPPTKQTWLQRLNPFRRNNND